MGTCFNRAEVKEEASPLETKQETKPTPVREAEPKSASGPGVEEETKPDPDMAEKVAEAPPDTGREDEAEVPEKPSTVEPPAVEAEQVAAKTDIVAEVAADQTPVPEKPSAAEPPAKQAVLYAVGDNVVVISSFTANSHHSHQLEPGMKGSVTEVDEEGDALVDFEDADELLWLYPDDLIHLEKVDDDAEDKQDM